MVVQGSAAVHLNTQALLQIPLRNSLTSTDAVSTPVRDESVSIRTKQF